MQVWIWLNAWTYDGLEILGVFGSEEAATAARDEASSLPVKVNSSVWGPYVVQ